MATGSEQKQTQKHTEFELTNSEEGVYCTYVTIGEGLAGGEGGCAFDGEIGEGEACIVQVCTYGERSLGGKLVVDHAAASKMVHSGQGDNTSISAFFLQTKFELQRCIVFSVRSM